MKDNKILPITRTLTLIGNDKVLDKKNGSIKRATDPEVASEIKYFHNKSNLSVKNLSEDADVVTSVGNTTIDFYLKTSDGVFESKSGFLIEVYESGSNGKLTRLYQEDLIDPLDGNNTLRDGFTNYFIIEVD
jgi:hypothetical protein